MERRARTMIEKHSSLLAEPSYSSFSIEMKYSLSAELFRSFYLKQVLQSVLKNLDGVRRIDNQVTVDWNDGLIGPNRN